MRTVLSEYFAQSIQLVIEYGDTGDATAHAVEQAKLAERPASFEKEVRERMAAAQQAAAAAELKAEAALQAAVAAQLKVEAALQAAGVAEVNTAAAAQEAVAQVRRDARAAHEELVRTVKGLELQVRWQRRIPLLEGSGEAAL